MTHELCRMTREEFAVAMAGGRWLILPFGTTEEHGAHLPLGSDMFQAAHVARAVAQGVRGVVAPGIPYGVCRSTRGFPGTISLSFATLEALAREIVSAYARRGARRLLILSGHAGHAHLEALRQAALAVVEQDERLTILVIGPDDIPLPPELESKASGADGHAGALETSVMLAIEAGRVRADRLEASRWPTFPPGRVLAHPERLFPTGVMGDPRGGSREVGERALAAFVAGVIRILRTDHPAELR